VMFFVAAVCLALAAAGWWLQRVAFNTDVSMELAEVVLQQPEIRAEIAEISAFATAASVGLPTDELRARIEQIAQTREGSELLRQVIADSHARLIGARDEPVQITGQQLVQIVRDERAANVPPVLLPVEEVAALRLARVSLDWTVPIIAIAGGVALLIGLVAHPRKADAVFGIGMFCLFAAVAALLLGWVLPVYGVPAISDSPWLLIISAVADHNRTFIMLVAAALVIGGLGLMMASASARRRRLWSTPVSTNRYSDQHRWS
jgi:hypothetical protein